MIPKFELFLNPFLKTLEDGSEHTLNEISIICADELHLTNEDRKDKLKSGQLRLKNRVNWSGIYLKNAGLALATKRGVYKITDEGLRVLTDNSKIDIDFLSKYESFRQFQKRNNSSEKQPASVDNQPATTPQEMLENAIEQLNSSLSEDLLNEVQRISAWDFENLVIKLLVKMGYGDLQRINDYSTSKTGDEGIDGIVSSDEFGFDSIAIQAKQWNPDSVVSRPEIQKFLGALAGQGFVKGIFITTARFSKEAISYAEKSLQQKIVLVDGQKLAQLMIKYNLGVYTSSTIEVKKIDTDFFADEI